MDIFLFLTIVIIDLTLLHINFYSKCSKVVISIVEFS